MLKKLYFHTHEGRSYDFDIVATAKVDDENQVITARYKN